MLNRHRRRRIYYRLFKNSFTRNVILSEAKNLVFARSRPFAPLRVTKKGFV